ncbi:MAG: c-type cytochrome biogenesis protein CcmI [Alphaproteobacteria bacterium]
MVFWLFIASLTGFTIFGLLWPLSRPPRHAPEIDDRDFYALQLVGIDQDLARGLIAPEAAEQARREAARRLLAAEINQKYLPLDVMNVTRRRIAAALLIVVLPLGAFALYSHTGSPGLPDQPLSSRLDSFARDADLSTLIAQVEARLETHPEDGMGWATIAPVYVSTGRYGEAVTAYTKAISLMGENADLRSGLGEARMAAAEGIVTAEALKEFERALTIDPKNERAQYYRAVAAEQDGDQPLALSLYQELARTIPPDSEPGRLIARRVEALTGKTEPAVPDATKDQGAMIRSMVQRLDERLTQDGSDLDGWLRLMRAYRVLGETDKAKASRERAKLSFTNDLAALAKIDAAARDMGL